MTAIAYTMTNDDALAARIRGSLESQVGRRLTQVAPGASRDRDVSPQGDTMPQGSDETPAYLRSSLGWDTFGAAR